MQTSKPTQDCSRSSSEEIKSYGICSSFSRSWDVKRFNKEPWDWSNCVCYFLIGWNKDLQPHGSLWKRFESPGLDYWIREVESQDISPYVLQKTFKTTSFVLLNSGDDGKSCPPLPPKRCIQPVVRKTGKTFLAFLQCQVWRLLLQEQPPSVTFPAMKFKPTLVAVFTEKTVTYDVNWHFIQIKLKSKVFPVTLMKLLSQFQVSALVLSTPVYWWISANLNGADPLSFLFRPAVFKWHFKMAAMNRVYPSQKSCRDKYLFPPSFQVSGCCF